MRGTKSALISLIMLIAIPLAAIMLTSAAARTVSAATIAGTVYDFSLEKVPKAQVTISTEPQQNIVAEDASYSFEVPPGTYTLTAQQLERGRVLAKVEENVSIRGEGVFHVDLILFPDFDDEELVSPQIFDEAPDLGFIQGTSITAILLIIAGAAILALFLFKIRSLSWKVQEMASDGISAARQSTKLTQNEEAAPGSTLKEGLPKDLTELVRFIKSQDGRTTQKDIRKQFPQSEAKISLMLADLEQRGKIQKIKKGRGNIILLK